MKNITKIIGIILLLGVVLIGFVGAVSAEDIEIISVVITTSDTPYPDKTISAITASATGTTSDNTPVTLPSPTLSWKENSNTPTTSTFSQGKTYTLEILVNPPSNSGDNAYTFKTNCDVKLNNSTITGMIQDDGKLKVTKTYTTPTLIDSVTISDLTAPTSGNTPDSTVTVTAKSGSNQVSNVSSTVSWKSSNSTSSMSSTDKFSNDAIYTATIELTAPSNYEFNNSVSVGEQTGTSMVKTVSTDKKKLTIKYTYTFTISSLTITNITEPSPGTYPVQTATIKANSTLSIASPTLTWREDDTNTTLSSSNSFESGKIYKVELTIDAPDGAKYGTSVSATVNGNTATVSRTSDTKVIVTYTFEVIITSVSISGLDEPYIGSTLDTSVTAKGGSTNSTIPSSVVWYEKGTTSAQTRCNEGVMYEAVITLTTPNNYTFKNTVDTNSISGAITKEVQYINENSIKVKYTFPKYIGTIKVSLDEPKTGKKVESAIATCNVTGANPTAKVTYSPEVTDKFKEQTEYTATIVVSLSSTDYVFDKNVKVLLCSNDAKEGDEEEIKDAKKTTSTITITKKYDKTANAGIISIGDDIVVPYPKDFFKEMIDLFAAIFVLENWKIFN